MPPSDPADEIANLREQIAELRRELHAARDASASASELTALREQLATAQRELEALRAAPTPAPSSKRLDGFFETEEPGP